MIVQLLTTFEACILEYNNLLMFAVVFWKSDLCSGEHGVLIEAEYSISGDGVVGQETAAYYLT